MNILHHPPTNTPTHTPTMSECSPSDDSCFECDGPGPCYPPSIYALPLTKDDGIYKAIMHDAEVLDKQLKVIPGKTLSHLAENYGFCYLQDGEQCCVYDENWNVHCKIKSCVPSADDNTKNVCALAATKTGSYVQGVATEGAPSCTDSSSCYFMNIPIDMCELNISKHTKC